MEVGASSLGGNHKLQTISWVDLRFSPSCSMTEDEGGAEVHGRPQVPKKREREQRDWAGPAFLSRVSLESVDSKILAGKQEAQPNPLASFWPNTTSSPAPQTSAKSWSSEGSGDFCNFDSQSTGPRQTKRFRKYCSHNPYAAQAAAASLLAGAAWLEAVQKLQALNSIMDPVGDKARNSR